MKSIYRLVVIVALSLYVGGAFANEPTAPVAETAPAAETAAPAHESHGEHHGMTAAEARKQCKADGIKDKKALKECVKTKTKG